MENRIIFNRWYSQYNFLAIDAFCLRKVHRSLRPVVVRRRLTSTEVPGGDHRDVHCALMTQVVESPASSFPSPAWDLFDVASNPRSSLRPYSSSAMPLPPKRNRFKKKDPGSQPTCFSWDVNKNAINHQDFLLCTNQWNGKMWQLFTSFPGRKNHMGISLLVVATFFPRLLRQLFWLWWFFCAFLKRMETPLQDIGKFVFSFFSLSHLGIMQ